MLRIEKLKAWYDKDILKNVNLDIDAGKIYGLLGVNGAGKTTLLNCINGLHENFSGNILMNNISIKKQPFDFKFERYFIPDYPILFEEMSGYNFIEIIHSTYNKILDKNKLEYYCEVFSFKKYLNQKISTLSLGNKQKVTIITALLLECKLLILDEPLVGLDVLSIENFYKEMKEYTKKGNSIIFSSHLIEVINSICDEVAILHDGSINTVLSVENNDIRDCFFKVTNNEC